MKNHQQLAALANDIYNDFEYEVDGIEFSLIDNVWIYRGTDEFTDWFTNVRVIPWHVDGIGWCHSGFIKTARKIFVRMLIETLKEDLDENIFQYTGHSLGGAIAQGCAAFMKSEGFNVAEVVTFGAPCVGKLPGLKSVPIVSYRHGSDPVPMTPMLMPRPRPLINLGKPGRWWRVADHSMDCYEKAIKK